MKRNILTLVCLSLAMYVLAVEPQYVIEELLGAKIAEVDAYNFVWNDSTGTATINESACAKMGMSCKLKSHSSKDGDVYLSNFYGDFEVPFKINTTTGIVTIEACQPLCTMYSYTNSAKSKSLTATGNACWTLYAVPYSWLMGNDDCGEYINGQVHEDFITFNDIFAFLVKTVDGDSVSWGLSPIFKNLTLLTPNGTHGFYYTRQVIVDLDPVGSGYGGLVPPRNKPGSSKPVSPRPISSVIGVNNPNSNISRFSKIMLDTHLSHIKDLRSVVGPVCLPDGHGGLVPPRPGSPGSSKPKSTGPYNDFGNGGEPGIDYNTVIKTAFNQNGTSWKTTYELEPVYMAFADDTTLMVYNLFGMGMRCHMKIDKNNGTMYLPRQQIYNDGLGRFLLNKSCDGTMSQNGAITWEKTESWLSNFPFYPKFESNILQFSGDSPFTVPLEPEFAEPVVTDTVVEFYATSNELNGIEVILYKYDEEADEYFEVENPLSVPRQDAPYWIYLAAEAYNPNTGVCSDITWLEYEVPALGTSNLRGDVNNDRAVNISDVTAMINGLLTGNWDEKNYHNANCNLDEEVNISDVTTLIHYLLNGNWSE